MKTAQQFKQAAIEHNIRYWNIRKCSLCEYQLGYIISNDYEIVGYDTGCYCVNYYPVILVSSYESIANFYNKQTSTKYIQQMNKFWRF